MFDLSRSIDLHLKSAGDTDEKAIDGRTSGLLQAGETVTWEGSHLGFKQSLKVKISNLERPQSFTDEMLSGAFARMKHLHRFEKSAESTLMTDEFNYKSRGGPIGWLLESSYLTAYLRRFLAERNKVIKRVAESNEWKEYLKDEPLRD